MHRDLACENVGVTDTGVCKVLDLGLAQMESLYPMRACQSQPLRQRWSAPETQPGSEDGWHSVLQSDIWSLGVLTWEVFTLGEDPYKDQPNLLAGLRSGLRLKFQIKAYLSTRVDYVIPREIKQFIYSCQSFHPIDRPTALTAEHIMHSIVLAIDTFRPSGAHARGVVDLGSSTCARSHCHFLV
jgi:serine/threonine protein kinase